jgi:hypothetical protein
MAQIHSYYITNAKSELKFSSINLSEDELEAALREITTNMINNDDIFIEDEDSVVLDDEDDEDINLNENDINNNLIIADIMKLDDFKEQDNNLDSSILTQESDETINYDVPNIDFEAILDEELGELNK